MAAPQFFETACAFRTWLDANASTETDLLVGYYKVGCGRPSMTWPESVDEALCVGWIDGVRRRVDDQAYTIRFTPRKPSSIWSAVNIAKFEQLSRQGRMTPAGERAYDNRTAAKSMVYAYEQTTTAELAAEELGAFQQLVGAWQYFEATPPSYKRVILHWITTAKRPETRAARLAKLMKACTNGERLR